MYHMLVGIVMILPSPSLSLVSCRTACGRCRGGHEQYPGILEVYCSMCRECNSRRQANITDLESPIPTCPTPPPCGASNEDVPPGPPQPLNLEITGTTSTQTPCPPVTGCIPTDTTMDITTVTIPTTTIPTTTTPTTTTFETSCKYPCVPPFCAYPCIPFCPYPCGPYCPYSNPQCPYPPSASESPRPGPSVRSAVTARRSSDLYVYVGVPRDVLSKKLRSWH